MTKRDSAGRGTRSHRERLTASTLLELLAREPGPVGWRELVALSESHDALARKALRNLVRGLQRSGELHQDREGHYYVASSDGREGVVEGRGKQLTFDGVPLEAQRGRRLRPGDRVEARVEGERAKVLRVIDYSATPLVGQLHARGRYPYVESLSPEYRGRVSLAEPPACGADGNTVAVQVLGEDRHGLVGVVTHVVSDRAGAAHAAETLLASYGVPLEWPEATLRAAERLPRSVQPARHADRVSLADLPLVTIDGETARDFDDAVYAEPTEAGGWRLVVAIADVGHYVKPGSALDQTAWERGNSVYLPDRVVPMLPEVLSNGLCSLRPHEPRLALVCDMRVSASGQVDSFEFYEAVIRSWQRLTYTRVQEFLEAGALDVEVQVQASLRALEAVYHALREAREARGALDFDSHESVMELADGHVAAIHPVTRLDAHRLIEEAMISANVCAAQFLEQHDAPGLYRVHEPPDAAKMDLLRQALAYAGLRLPQGQLGPAELHAALGHLRERPDRWIFEMMTLRAMQQAVYAPENKGHYGLALERYMHFTSPIRRYADLVVHRAIKAVLGGDRPRTTADWLVMTGEHISMTERRAEEVSWGVEGWLKCEYIGQRVGETFDGVVMGVTEFGLFVELTGFYVQGLLHISGLGADYFRFEPSAMALIGDRSGRRFGLGDQLRVQLMEVQPAVGKVDLALVSGPTGDAGADGARDKTRSTSAAAAAARARGRSGKSRAGKGRSGRR
ncbi:MAG: ribonuclease R [Pseudomonadales bacterium]